MTPTPLPPIGAALLPGDAEQTIVDHLSGLARESVTDNVEHIERADRSLNVYHYGQWPPPVLGDGTVVINEIQNAIIAATDIQTKEPPTATLEPVETGEPPQYFWAGPDWVGVALGLPEPYLTEWLDPTTQQLSPPLPLDPDAGEQLQDAAMKQVPVAVDPQTGMPVALKEDWVVAVNDELVAETYQSVFDVLWAKSGMTRRIRSNLLVTNVHGWSFWLYEWDDANQLPIVRPMSPRQVYVDPTVEDVSDAQYAGVDWVVDAEEAKVLYPHLAEKIALYATENNPARPDQNTTFGAAVDRVYERPTVTLRVFWLRNQPIAYAPEEAAAMGLVTVVEEPVEPATEDQAADQLAGLMPRDEEQGNAAEDQGGARPLADAVSGEGGENPVGDTVAPVPTHLCYYLPDGTKCEPGDARWPSRRGIRQTIVLATGQVTGIVADDAECPHWDVPLLHNVNIPIPGTPYGLGEPYRLESIQRANSRLVNAMVENAEYYRAPIMMVSEFTHSKMSKELQEAAYIKPGTLLIVEDAVMQAAGGKIIMKQDPPALPAPLVQLQPILSGLITDQSGHSEVLQGRASSQLSGKAIETLQTSAASMIGFKSQRTGDMVYRLARLILHCIVHRMAPEDVQKIVSKYPPHVTAAIHKRAREMDWDVAVSISSGNGALKTQKKLQDQEDLKIGALDMESYRDRNNIDHKLVERRQAAAMEKQARMAAQLAPQQPGAAGESEQQKPPS